MITCQLTRLSCGIIHSFGKFLGLFLVSCSTGTKEIGIAFGTDHMDPGIIRILLVFMLLCSIPRCSHSQNIIFDEVTNKDGLYSNQYYYYLYQDSKGFIWVGNIEGLQRYDGYAFKNFDQVRGARYFTEDSRNCLWMGSDYYLYLMDPATGELALYLADPMYTATGNIIEDKDGIIWCAARVGLLRLEPKEHDADRQKNLIFNEGIEEAFIVTLFKPNPQDDYALENQVNKIFSDSNERLWIGSAGGLLIFDPASGEFAPVKANHDEGQRTLGQNILDILEEDEDVIWIRTQQGLTRISDLPDPFSMDSEINMEIYIYPFEYSGETFMIDHQHNYWIGVPERGLIRMDIGDDLLASFSEVYTGLYELGGIESSNVTSILEDRTGLIWVAHQYPRIRKFRKDNNLFIRLEGLLGKYPRVRYDFNQVIEDADENIWICTWGTGLFKISQKGSVSKYDIADPDITGQQTNNALSLLEVDEGILWISTYYPASIYQLNTRTGTFKRILSEPAIHGTPYWMYKKGEHVIIGTETGVWSYDLISGGLTDHSAYVGSTEGLRGNMWVAGKLMENGNLYWCSDSMEIVRFHFDPETVSFERLQLPDSIESSLAGLLSKDLTGINVMYEDQNGNLWIQIQKESLLIRFNLSSGEIRTWNERDGVTSNRIAAMTEDSMGNLWYVYDYGLSMLDERTGMLRTFDENDGLPIMNQSRYIWADSKGVMYFGGMGSLYRVDPENIYKNDVIPNIVITDFKLFNTRVEVDRTSKGILDRDISYAEEIKLKHSQHDISFTFAALDFNDPAKNRYAYTLEGYQQDWIETGADNRIAAYTNLSPGTYTFRVKGTNNNGIWNEEGASIRIVINPPFWKTAWAYVSYGMAALLLIWGIISWRTKSLTKEKAILEHQVAERTQKIEMQNEELMQQKEELQSTLENLKKTQDQLIESEKMAAVGGLVAGVAHEINTPIGIGITAITNLMEEVEKMALLYDRDEISRSDFRNFLQSTREVASLTQKNLERTAALVQSLKQVSVDQVTEQKRIFALKEYLHDILISLKPKFSGKEITFVIECDEELTLNSYPGVYAQIFTNLLINSVQHGFNGRSKGKVTVKACIQNDLLGILYSDDGNGIGSEDLPHIFEPFYTSEKHRGTGLGLHIVYNLIRQKLQGNIACESEPGQGVLFTLTLPVD